MLKLILIQTLVLMIMDFLKENIILCTNASDLANDIVLMQDKQVVVHDFSKLNLAELNNLVHEELLAMIHALKIWKHYLFRVKFKIKKLLKYIYIYYVL